MVPFFFLFSFFPSLFFPVLFLIGFPPLCSDESEFDGGLAKIFGISHHTFHVERDLMSEALEEALDNMKDHEYDHKYDF